MPHRLTTLVLGSVLLVTAGGCRISFSGYNFDYRGVKSAKTETGEVNADVTSIVVKNEFGNVSVQEGKPGWEWEGACWATDIADSVNFLQDLEIVVNSNGPQQTWTVVLPKRSSKLRGVQSDLTIFVPRSVSVKLSNEHGDVEITDIGGKVELLNGHGDVKATMVPQLQITNEHGHVVTESTDDTVINNEHGSTSVTGAGRLTIRSEHGKVKVDSAAVVDVDLEHGSFSGTRISSSCKINAEHAKVKVTMGNDKFSAIKIIGEHSPITINLPNSSRPSIKTVLDHGRLRSDFTDSANSNQSIYIDSEHGNVTINSVR